MSGLAQGVGLLLESFCREVLWPDDFSFASFPFLMTIQGGQITKFEQVWVP